MTEPSSRSAGALPSYWLRQRNGHPGGHRLTADEAALVAQRSGAVGDHFSPRGLIWSEPDPHGPDGFSFYTITPVWENAMPDHVNHGEYVCPGCCTLAEYRIVRDVYGCDAGRHCTQATPEQRIAFEKQITERMTAERSDPAEAT